MTTLGSAMGFTFDAINGVANDAMPTLNNQASTFVDTMGPQRRWDGWQSKKRATEAQIVDWMQAGYTVDEIQSVLLPAYLNKLRSANSGDFHDGRRCVRYRAASMIYVAKWIRLSAAQPP